MYIRHQIRFAKYTYIKNTGLSKKLILSDRKPDNMEGNIVDVLLVITRNLKYGTTKANMSKKLRFGKFICRHQMVRR